MNKLILTLLIAIFVAGCAIGPDYKRPVIDNPAAWRLEEEFAKDTANTMWWYQFNDPVMNSVDR